MAKIVKTGVQETALKAVQGNLRALAGVNILLDSGEEKYGITFAAGRKKVFMVAGKALGESILEDVRRKLVSETCLLARRNSIRLENQELSVLEKRPAGKHAGGKEEKKLTEAGNTGDAASGTCSVTEQ